MGEGSALSNCEVANIKAMRKELWVLEELNVGPSLRGNGENVTLLEHSQGTIVVSGPRTSHQITSKEKSRATSAAFGSIDSSGGMGWGNRDDFENLPVVIEVNFGVGHSWRTRF
jgi:hypothetical protein